MHTETMPQRRNTTKGTHKSFDAWDGVLDEDENCVYCGHSKQLHGGLALMVAKPKERVYFQSAGRYGVIYGRRKRIGLDSMWCLQCAEDAGTDQVVCYKVPAVVKELAKACGLRVG